MTTVLVVEDDQPSLQFLVNELEAEGCETLAASSLASANTLLASCPRPDLALIDVGLPDGSGLDLLPHLSLLPIESICLVTGHESLDAALNEVGMGKIRHCRKPISRKWVKALLSGASAQQMTSPTPSSLRAKAEGANNSHPMTEVNQIVARVADSSAAILLRGESGVGKEVIARRIHAMSERRDTPFVALNCGAVAPGLIDSELFGHDKGAFTGADSARSGVLERAREGTLLLDEITEMPMELQTRLLRVLEGGDFRRVGGQKDLQLSARVIATTNRDPAQAIAEGFLREDLYFRIAVVEILVPPLRERSGDTLRLARQHIEHLSIAAKTEKTLSPSSEKLIERLPWPGNVRQLHNVLHFAFLMSSDDIVRVHNFPENLRSGLVQAEPDKALGGLSIDVGVTLADVEKKVILATLDHYKGDKNATAKSLGVSVRTLYTRLRIYAETSALPTEPTESKSKTIE